MLDEHVISRAIIERYTEKLLSCLSQDVVIVGAGPAGLVAAYYLARGGCSVTLFERKLSVGGGMWGGGMMFNEIVVQEEAKRILDELGVHARHYESSYYTADAVEAVSTICSRAAQAGARIVNLVSVEDVAMEEAHVTGLVVNWTAVEMGGLHVDPLSVKARFIVDATGHDASVIHLLARQGWRLCTPSGQVEGQGPLWADRAESATLLNTREVYPGVYVAGMCANATFGACRMGPIFGGMLLSGEKVATLILERLAQAS
ncbi:MAG: thiazole biosynthesis protein [Actinobacteria bacterium]|jgi:thiamine thiazole synthase|nr:thiazole biosynthesis protein [Actinomycetota bacterium]